MLNKIYQTDIINNIEKIYYFTTTRSLTNDDLKILSYIIPNYTLKSKYNYQFKIGPRTNFQSPWSSNAISILKRIGFPILNIEMIKSYPKEIEFDKMTHQIYNDNTKIFKNEDINISKCNRIDNISEYNTEASLSLDDDDILYYKNLFEEIGRNPTDIELFDLSQSNSEHSRHWFFRGLLYFNEDSSDINNSNKSLFDMVKRTLQGDNSLVAFSDNSSVIRGHEVKDIVYKNLLYTVRKREYDIVFTAETHNFPTGIAPFPGASTGTGGRIRDNIAVGRGGMITAGTAGYCVGSLNIPGYEQNWERDLNLKYINDKTINEPLRILIEASNGASDYGNKIGEPIIQGFTRSFGAYINKDRIEWLKPIMFSAGLGQIPHKFLKKEEPEEGMNIVRMGGPAFRIGVGGGAASSRVQTAENLEVDLNSVQRGDPQMENRLVRVIRRCLDMGTNNPIKSIHDQGAGGLGNVVKELVEPIGGLVDLKNVTLGDKTMTSLEIWSAEFQESVAILAYDKDLEIIRNICNEENVHFDLLGKVFKTGKIQVLDTRFDKEYIVDLDLEKVLGDVPRKKYLLTPLPQNIQCKNEYFNTVYQGISEVFKLVSVGSKRFLTNKVDRSVTGLIARQQCIGPLGTPISDFASVTHTHFDVSGAVTAIGEQPIKGILNPGAMARLTVIEMLNNIIWGNITNLEDIKCSGNWMWPLKMEGEKYKLWETCKSMVKFMRKLGVSIDGGKDSLSMSVTTKDGDIIKSPSTLVVSGYVGTDDVTKSISQCLKRTNGKSYVIWIDFSPNQKNLGGSAFQQVFSNIGGNTPDFEPNGKKIEIYKRVFKLIQKWINEGIVKSGHDISDGGLVTALAEMCISSNIGLDINIENLMDKFNYNEILFAEEPGLLLQIDLNKGLLKRLIELNNITKNEFGISIIGEINDEFRFRINGNKNLLDISINELRYLWESTSYQIEKIQADSRCVKEEFEFLINNEITKIPYKFDKNFEIPNNNFDKNIYVGIVREEGSNGDKEMISAFIQSGFQVIDMNMNKLNRVSSKNSEYELAKLFSRLKCMAFVGGFSYADVFGAGKGWSASIKYNNLLYKYFEDFYLRDDTLSLGICNGCQLMCELGWVGNNIELTKNESNRFESRFSFIEINNKDDKSPWLMGMDGWKLGVWSAHGEGRFIIDDDSSHNIAMKYLNLEGEVTDKYPFNPNGSKFSCAGCVSNNGHHLVMMPHPERTFLEWEWPDYIGNEIHNWTPWIKLFTNAYKWLSVN